MADDKSVSGTEQAAILLMSLGEQEAAAVLQKMGMREVQKLSRVMASMRRVNRVHAEAVLENFTSNNDTDLDLGGSPDYLRKVLSGSVGAEKAGNILERIVDDGEPKGLESLHLMEAREVTEMIRNEHPQIIAIVMARLEQEQAAEVLSQLPPGLATDVVTRIARLEEVPQSALEELDEIVEQQFSRSSNFKAATIGGTRTAAEILNLVDSRFENEIMEALEKEDSALSQEIQDKMFVFENLMEVDDRGIQALVREITGDTLVVALKGADTAMRDKIFRNMSKRAAEIMESDLEAKGPVRLSEVEEAQKEIVYTARRLADEGSLILGKGGEEYV
ncbi:MAG: flagellar motor switch protein FliG [Gammaproteobacteria bacterium]|jgi:flagellar motor switch protein FliG